jgi:hypothetical protein
MQLVRALTTPAATDGMARPARPLTGLVLVDWDPYGMHIFLQYLQGSRVGAACIRAYPLIAHYHILDLR